MALELPQHFAALIFDCDGTLVDTAPAHYSAVSQALGAQGHAMERSWYMARTGLTPQALLDAHEARLEAARPRQKHPEAASEAPPLDRAALYGRYDELYRASLPLLREIGLVADLARAWHGSVPMAVASNGHRENVQASLRSVGLLHLFDFVVSAEDVARGKPAPDLFLAASSRMGVPPQRCVVLEDSDEGIAAAHAAGMPAVDVRPSLQRHPSI